MSCQLWVVHRGDALQWYIRAPLHHARRGDVARATAMVFASLAYLAVGAFLWSRDPLAACLLVFVPHGIRLFGMNAMNEYAQHALVDARRGHPEDPANNSFLLLRESSASAYPRGLRVKAGNWEDRWYAVHHNFPRKHMSQLSGDCAKIQCNLVFDMDYAAFRKAAMIRDVAALAQAWRPGYRFGPGASAEPGDSRARESGLDAALDMAGREAAITTFFMPAFPRGECGPWASAPSWPFNVMKATGAPTPDKAK